MKTFKYISISLLALSSIFSSCSLERNPLDKFSENVFWNSEDNAILAIIGIYRSNIQFNGPEYNPSDWWSYGGLLFLEFASDNAYDRRGSNSNFHKLSDGNLLANNAYINNYWSNSYKKIYRCNNFLQNIDKLSASQAVIDRLKAEARFLRATQYFYLSQYFHDVPLVTQILSLDEANTVKKSPKSDIVNFVILELTEASKHLPNFKKLKAEEQGRASKQASLAFLGRALLAENRFEEAATTYEEIINMGENSIDPNYQSLFYPSNENSSENIFSMQYLQDLAGSGLPQHAYPVKDGGWCIINLTASLFEAYQFNNGESFDYNNKLYDNTNLGKNRDPRLDYTIYYNQAEFMGAKYVCHPDSQSLDKIMTGQTTQTGFMPRKYFDESFNGNINSYGGNIPIIRYAEILLSYLEAKIESGAPITQSLLDNTINKIRGRASVNMPFIKETNPEKLREIVRNERRVELAMEGIRYWDLLRWRTAEVELNADIYGAPFPGSKRMNYKKENGQNIIDPHSRWFVNSRAFRKALDYKWPIPQSEQNINPNLRE